MNIIMVPFPGGWWGVGLLAVACLALGFLFALFIEDQTDTREWKRRKESERQ